MKRLKISKNLPTPSKNLAAKHHLLPRNLVGVSVEDFTDALLLQGAKEILAEKKVLRNEL